MNKFYMAVLSLLFMGVVFGCNKSYTLAPIPVPTSTPTPIATNTPCGYPGFTCTWTFTTTKTNTPTATSTPTNTSSPTFTRTSTWTGTPTNTFTATATYTPTALPTPQGVIGLLNNTTNLPLVAWAKDTNPNISGYKIYMSTDGVTYSLYGTYAKTVFSTTLCAVNDTPAGTTFNRYYYVTSTNGGSPPDSVPSRVVHAVSGTTLNGGLTLAVYSGGTPVNLRITGGSAPGAVKRVWFVEDFSYNPYWMWGEEAVVLTTPNYGAPSGGVTYYAASALSSGATYSFDTFSLNSENWETNWTSQGFICP